MAAPLLAEATPLSNARAPTGHRTIAHLDTFECWGPFLMLGFRRMLSGYADKLPASAGPKSLSFQIE